MLTSGAIRKPYGFLIKACAGAFGEDSNKLIPAQ
jgi:hypothetical protein